MSSKLVPVFWKVFFYGLGAFLLFLVLINLGVFGSLPSLKELENPSITQASEVFAEDGTPMGKYYKDKGNRSNVEFKDISPNVVNALVATEDDRFYEHSGIDGFSVMRAVIKLGRDGGGSTITQQLAKNLLDQGSKNLIRRFIEKLKEWIIAIKLERNFTKQEILTLYLNDVPFGDNVYGIRNASRTFFQKEPDRLSRRRSRRPDRYAQRTIPCINPRKNPKMAIERRNTVINQMIKYNYLTDEEGAGYKAQPIDLSHYQKGGREQRPGPLFPRRASRRPEEMV